MEQISDVSRFNTICSSYIHREGIDSLLNYLNTSDYFTAPASAQYHNAYYGGLLNHSLNVFDNLVLLYNTYSDKIPTKYTMETLAIIALFHDLCKVNSYQLDYRNVKNETTGKWEKVPYYRFSEKFHFGGHSRKSIFLIERFMRLTEDEAIAINCHMGAFDDDIRKEISSIFSANPLALLLHMADMMATNLTEK